MTTVGIRELKNRLSEYLRLVRAGEDLLVTDRGEVIAEVRKAGQNPTRRASGLEDLERRGLARGGSDNQPGLYPALEPIGVSGLAESLLDAERGQR